MSLVLIQELKIEIFGLEEFIKRFSKQIYSKECLKKLTNLKG